MKLFLLLIPFLLFSCYLELDQPNVLNIDVSRRNVESPQFETDALRVYLLDGDLLVPMSEYGFDEFQVSGNQVEIGPVNLGREYRIIAAIGDYEGNIFVPREWAFSDEFYASDGVIVDLVFNDSDFVLVGDTLGKSLVDVESLGDDIFTASSNDFYYTTFIDLDFDSLSVPSNVNSLSIGASLGDGEVIWLNTSSELMSYDGSIQVMGGKTFPGGVLDSGGFILNGNFYGYVRYNGGFTGLFGDGEVTSWFMEVDLSDIVVGEPIYSFAVTEDRGYFSTKLGSFSVPAEMLENDEISTIEEVLDGSDFFDILIDGHKTYATHMAIGDVFVYGTPRGVVVDGTTIPFTRNREIKNIFLDGNVLVVETRHFLLISENLGSSFSIIPVYALPLNNITGITLSNNLLLFSGDNGLFGLYL